MASGVFLGIGEGGVDKEIVDFRPTCNDLAVKCQCQVTFSEHDIDVCACHAAN